TEANQGQDGGDHAANPSRLGVPLSLGVHEPVFHFPEVLIAPYPCQWPQDKWDNEQAEDADDQDCGATVRLPIRHVGRPVLNALPRTASGTKFDLGIDALAAVAAIHISHGAGPAMLRCASAVSNWLRTCNAHRTEHVFSCQTKKRTSFGFSPSSF